MAGLGGVMAFMKMLKLAVGQLSGAGVLVVCGVFALGVVWAVVSRVRGAGDAEVRVQSDRLADPRRTWVQGVTFLLQRGHDHAYLPVSTIEPMLRGAWGISSKEQLDAQVAELAEQDVSAWSRLRAMLLLRSAVAMGWSSNDASFARCWDLGQDLQGRYRSFEEMSEDLLRARRSWFAMPTDGSGDDEGMKEILAMRDELWVQVPWGQSLS